MESARAAAPGTLRGTAPRSELRPGVSLFLLHRAHLHCLGCCWRLTLHASDAGPWSLDQRRLAALQAWLTGVDVHAASESALLGQAQPVVVTPLEADLRVGRGEGVLSAGRRGWRGCERGRAQGGVGSCGTHEPRACVTLPGPQWLCVDVSQVVQGVLSRYLLCHVLVSLPGGQWLCVGLTQVVQGRPALDLLCHHKAPSRTREHTAPEFVCGEGTDTFTCCTHRAAKAVRK